MKLQKTSKPLDEKRLWRDSIKAELQRHSKELPDAAFQAMQDRLVAHLCEYLKNQSGIWAGYRALPQEPDLSSVYQQMSHLTWTFPRMQDDDLHFHVCENFEQGFISGKFGVSEPAADSPVVPTSKLDGVLVPGLGFDNKGRRLGRGRGFYDRALSGYQGFKIGVGFQHQVIEKDLPVEAHDVPMNALVTETAFRVI